MDLIRLEIDRKTVISLNKFSAFNDNYHTVIVFGRQWKRLAIHLNFIENYFGTLSQSSSFWIYTWIKIIYTALNQPNGYIVSWMHQMKNWIRLHSKLKWMFVHLFQSNRIEVLSIDTIECDSSFFKSNIHRVDAIKHLFSTTMFFSSPFNAKTIEWISILMVSRRG